MAALVCGPLMDCAVVQPSAQDCASWPHTLEAWRVDGVLPAVRWEGVGGVQVSRLAGMAQCLPHHGLWSAAAVNQSIECFCKHACWQRRRPILLIVHHCMSDLSLQIR